MGDIPDIDAELDRCRHGKTAGEICGICDYDDIDLRDLVDPRDEPSETQQPRNV